MTVRTLSLEEYRRDPSLAEGSEPVSLTQDGRTVKILVDPERMAEAIAAWKTEQDRAAVLEGVADFETGRTVTLDDLKAELRADYGL